jgi:hypothetical protein
MCSLTVQTLLFWMHCLSSTYIHATCTYMCFLYIYLQSPPFTCSRVSG